MSQVGKSDVDATEVAGLVQWTRLGIDFRVVELWSLQELGLSNKGKDKVAQLSLEKDHFSWPVLQQSNS